VRVGSFGVGLDLGLSWAQNVAIDGYVVPDATRLRARVPRAELGSRFVQLRPLAFMSGERLG